MPLALREPDRVPVGLWGTIEGYQNLRRGIGMDYKTDPKDYRTGSTTWTTDVSFELDLAARLELDFVRISAGSPGGSPGFRPIKFEEVPFDMGIPPRTSRSTSTNGGSSASGPRTSRAATTR